MERWTRVNIVIAPRDLHNSVSSRHFAYAQTMMSLYIANLYTAYNCSGKSNFPISP